MPVCRKNGLTGRAPDCILDRDASQIRIEESTVQEPRTAIRIQDIRTLFRAREIMNRLAIEGLEAAIEAARAMLVGEKSRRQYLQEILPAPTAYMVPGTTETFVVECADARRFHLQNGTLPLLWQIAELEHLHDTQAVKVIHCNGHRQRVYWL
jgi:hypothetical protein